MVARRPGGVLCRSTRTEARGPVHVGDRFITAFLCALTGLGLGVAVLIAVDRRNLILDGL
jgi:hypothetical protein